MRLLHVKADGEFSLTEFFGEIPPYAVLSHTWGPDSEEVSFKDLMKRRGKDKSGYKKLRFCATQAAHDGLAYFWVDTCCIDKSSSAELSEAINSMFSWYKKAAKCYVFLADVSQSTWRSTFVKSKWFTRGWTLQELLAPTSVTFFTQHGYYLGNKYTLLADIQKTTNIPAHALLESHLSMNNFSVEERLSWAAGRETKREEDAAYSLLGLFDLHMPLIYGEGRAKAFIRLRKEIRSTSDNKEVNDLHTPLFEMTRPNHIEPFQTTRTHLTITRDPLAVMSTRHQKWWREAISDGKSPELNHERVSVLLIRWVNEFDELQTYEEVEELESVFHEHFHFRTNIVELSAQNEFEARDQFDLHVDSFVRLHDGSRNLLIIYYAGNGWYIPDIKHMVLRRAQSNLLSPQLRHIQGDILAILDTPYTSVVGADQRRDVEEDVAYIESEERLKQRRRFELMTVGEDLGGIGGKTFTRSLTDALRKHRTESFSTRDLHKWILKDTQRSETPLMLWSLLPNKQNICLAPVQPPQMQMVCDQNLSSGYLKLGLAFGEDSLNRDQIKHLVHALTRTIDPEIVPLCRVELLDFKRYTLISRFQRVASVVRAVLRWKTYVRERKEWRRMEWRRTEWRRWGLWDD